MQSYLCFLQNFAIPEASMATVDDLPCELLLDIFDGRILNGNELLRAARTCQQWRHIFQTSLSM
jgi:hypothetical protein